MFSIATPSDGGGTIAHRCPRCIGGRLFREARLEEWQCLACGHAVPFTPVEPLPRVTEGAFTRRLGAPSKYEPRPGTAAAPIPARLPAPRIGRGAITGAGRAS